MGRRMAGMKRLGARGPFAGAHRLPNHGRVLRAPGAPLSPPARSPRSGGAQKGWFPLRWTTDPTTRARLARRRVRAALRGS